MLEEKQFQTGEREKLQKDLEDKEKEIKALTYEIDRLKTSVTALSSRPSGTGISYVEPLSPTSIISGLGICSKCRNIYPRQAVGDKGLCPGCEKLDRLGT